MRALFPPWSNTALHTGLVVTASGAIGLPAFLMLWVRTPLETGQNDPVEQPVEFDHRHHVDDGGIDCRHCHDLVEKSRYAGVPATSRCMNCHAQIWNDATATAPLRISFYENRALEWQRVHKLPDFVFFHHAAHVRRGVGCVSCHGRVDQMARVYRVAPLTMGWCLDCHRRPETHLRPLDRITDMEWSPDRPQIEVGLEIKERLGIRPPVRSCTGCHR